ncbi:WXG100 family type VII secretion target [Actinacidiphila yanglinensis]|uniref:WXG100 family type VII secretion target n=1 Tax=Actinacidiphila yanglinensis TaxID=310779 RepID=A0A1H6E4S8_9ACTN|nr:WXG100 family type VII secretion target [Actinacidiphila yanglinensis]SEG91996.1 WXG100 family type VII secretion target [Actinacidiphila yanglinensis]
MTPPSGNGSAVGDSAATPVSPMLDRTAADAGTPASPVLDRTAADAASPSGTTVAAQPRTPAEDRQAGGTDRHVLTSSKTSSLSDRNGTGGGSGTSGALHELRVALGELQTAITKVNGHREAISDLLAEIQSQFTAAHDAWQSPSATTFETTATWFTQSSRALKDLLDEMARRMRSTYDTYHAVETANTHNSGG